MPPENKYTWNNASLIHQISYLCGFCNKDTAPSRYYFSDDGTGKVYICPNCTKPTFFDIDQNQTPKPLLGQDIVGISNEKILSLHEEARGCTSVGAYTAAVMICRKILMNLAVEKEAKENQCFAYYVDFLFDKGYIPPQGKKWVDEIRKRGNEANHEIALMKFKDARLVLHFVESLLRFNYELPHLFEEDNNL